MIAGHQLGLGFREVEGCPVCLRDAGDQVEEESREKRDDEPPGVLGIDDVDELEGAGQDENRHQRQAQRHLVADHLRGRPKRTEQRVLAVGGVAGEEDTEHAD